MKIRSYNLAVPVLLTWLMTLACWCCAKDTGFIDAGRHAHSVVSGRVFTVLPDSQPRVLAIFPQSGKLTIDAPTKVAASHQAIGMASSHLMLIMPDESPALTISAQLPTTKWLKFRTQLTPVKPRDIEVLERFISVASDIDLNESTPPVEQVSVLTSLLPKLPADLAPMGYALLAHFYRAQYKFNDEVNTLNHWLASPYTTSQTKSKAHLLLAYVHLHELNDLAQANAHLVEAKDKLLTTTPSLHLAALSIMEGDYCAAQGKFSQAIHHYETALLMYRQLGNEKQTMFSIVTLGWFYYKQGHLPLAQNHYEQALIYAQQADPHTHVEVLTKLATIYRKLGNYYQASRHVERAIALASKQTSSLNHGYALQEKALLYKGMGDFNLAKRLFEQAHDVFSAENSSRNVSNMEYFLSMVCMQLGQYQQALTYAKRVVANDRNSGNDYYLATGLSRLGSIMTKLGHYPQAQIHHGEAIALATHMEDTSLKIRILLQSIDSSVTANNFTQAVETVNEINRLTKLVPAPTLLTEGYYKLAKGFYFAKDNTNAQEYLERGFSALTESAITLSQRKAQQTFVAMFQDMINLEVSIAKQNNQPDQEILDTLLTRRQHQLVYPATKWTSEDKEKFDELNYQVQALTIATINEPSNEAIRNELALTQNDIALIAANYDFGYQATFVSSNRLSLATHQQHWPPNQAFFIFETGEIANHGWLVTHTDIRYIGLPNSDQLTSLASQYSNMLRHQPANTRNVAKTMQQIKQSALADIVNTIPTHIDELGIIADGVFHSLPLGAIAAYQSTADFQRTLSVTYYNQLPDPTVLPQPREKNRWRALLVGDPTMTGIPQNLTRLIGRDGQLPYSQVEVNKIQSMFAHSPTVLINEHATKQSLLRQLDSGYDVIHFATHGIASQAVRYANGLVLSNADSDNFLLVPSEIRHLSINPDLVVLSGCETMIGQYLDGTGLTGLSQAFFESGAKQVVASLWQVQDDATAMLMSYFYRYMTEDNLSVASALAHAKRDIRTYQRKNGSYPWRSPYFWAGFVAMSSGESPSE